MATMKKTLFLILSVLFSVGSIFAQQVTISPLPQHVTWGEMAFSKSELANIPIIRGKVGDKAVARYRKQVPAQAEGYYLKVTPTQIIMVGRDDAGLFYAQQTLDAITAVNNIMQCEITDWPSVSCRGVIEGFYGNPWSHQDRLRQFDFYGRNKLNTYVYGPKDDPYHRKHWRDPYPEQEAAKLRELVEAAHRNHVQFVWAVHPGGDIQWNKSDSMAVVRKLESMYALGVRTFAVFFDDIWGEGSKGEKQAGLLNYVTDNFVHKHKDVKPLIMCPTQYNKSWSHGDYLSTLGTKMYPEVRIMWTGNSVVDMIEKNDMEWINDQIRRKAFIWLNYPVNDYCQSRLLMGKTYGNGLDIADMVSGFCSNPMEYAEASKVSLYSIADYTWNMPQYDSESSWERAIDVLLPTASDAFMVFCQNNVDLGPTGHGLRREGESLDFNTNSVQELANSFESLVWAANNLSADSVNNPEMINEIHPWVQSMRLLGRRGQQYISMLCALANNDSIAFIGHYRAQLLLEREQKAITSRDYPGSIVKAKPVVSGDVITPWLNQNIAELLKIYRGVHNYGVEYFPVQAIADGEYLIRAGGMYLTNRDAGADNVGDAPVFTAERDVINPQRQQWIIEQDTKTGRYKITNKQDGRYINEIGRFWRTQNNRYNADWNTYLLVRQNGKWSIQNAGLGGKKYWNIDSDHITTTPTESFVFEFEEVK